MTMTAEQRAQLREEVSNPANGSKDHLRKLSLALLDELETKEEQRANWFRMAQKLGEDLDAIEKLIAEQREYYEGVIADGSKRIAALEARTVTVTLPESPGPMSLGAKTVYCGIVADVVASFQEACAAAGINLTVEG